MLHLELTLTKEEKWNPQAKVKIFIQIFIPIPTDAIDLGIFQRAKKASLNWRTVKPN